MQKPQFDNDSLLDLYSASRSPSPHPPSKMPVYLLHGFRWPRPLIRIHIILQNLEDAAAEWLVAPDTTETMLENFHEIFPDTMKYLPTLRFVEQHDPDDISPAAGSQPYAYVADVVHTIKLGLDVDEIRGKGVSNEQWGALLELRDKLAPEEKVGWYVVVCGDEERFAPPQEVESEGEEEEMYETAPVSMGPPLVPMPQNNGTVPKSPTLQKNGPVPMSPTMQNNGITRSPPVSPSKALPRVPPQIPPPPPAHELAQYDAAYRTRTAGSISASSTSTVSPLPIKSIMRYLTMSQRKAMASPTFSRSSKSPELGRKSFSSPDTPQRGFKKLLGSLSRRKR